MLISLRDDVTMMPLMLLFSPLFIDAEMMLIELMLLASFLIFIFA